MHEENNKIVSRQVVPTVSHPQQSENPEHVATATGLPDDTGNEGMSWYELLFNNVSEALLIHIDRMNETTMPGIFVEVNDAACRLLGYTRDELLGMSARDIDGEKTVAEMQTIWEELQKEKQAVWETSHRHKSGGEIPVEIRSRLFQRQGDRVIISTVLDISNRRKMVKALQASEEKYRDLFEKANDGIMVVDRDNNFLDVNRKMEEMLEYSREELLKMNIFDIVPPEQKDHDIKRLSKFFTGALDDKSQSIAKTKSGKTLEVETSTSAILVKGEFAGMRCIIRDITERKQMVATLRESEQLLKETQELSRVGGWSYDVETGRMKGTDEAYRILGFPRGCADGGLEPDYSFFTPEDKAIIGQAFQDALQKGEPYDKELLCTGKDGEKKWVRSIGRPAYRDGVVTKVIGNIMDITERKQVEENIRQSEEFIRGILDTVDEGFIVIDPEYRILTANKAFCTQYARNCDDMIGRHCYEVSLGTNRPCSEEGKQCVACNVFATGHPDALFQKQEGSNGQIIYADTKAFPIRDGSGTIVSVVKTINNITEKHLLAEERLKTQKLESIGTLAGGIAHDFNNMLQGVFGYISLARMTLDRESKSSAMLDQAEKALKQSVSLTNQLLTFSKGGKPVTRPLPLKPVIENAIKFALSGSATDFQLQVEPGLWQVKGDEGQLGQVIQNIVLNADQSMPLGGLVRIFAQNIAGGEAILPSSLPDGNYVRLQIEDRGVGIPAAIIGRIFDPYFTTKAKGSGLGLATSYSIIQNHGGKIDVSSEVGQGTIFSLYLPACADSIETNVTEDSVPSAVMKVRVLFMDDEELIRDIAVEQLQALGNEVEAVHNGEEALARYTAAVNSGRPFDIVILDLTIRGGMGGLETMGELRKIDPDIRVIVSSGYSEDAAIADYRKHGFKAFLKKPYKMNDLGNALQAVLAK